MYTKSDIANKVMYECAGFGIHAHFREFGYSFERYHHSKRKNIGGSRIIPGEKFFKSNNGPVDEEIALHETRMLTDPEYRSLINNPTSAKSNIEIESASNRYFEYAVKKIK